MSNQEAEPLDIQIMRALRTAGPLPLTLARRGDDSYVWRLLEYDETSSANPGGEAETFVQALAAAFAHLEVAYTLASVELDDLKQRFGVIDEEEETDP